MKKNESKYFYSAELMNQALLELLKHQFIVVEQDELFSTITIRKNPNRSEDEDIGEIDEYN